MIEHRGTAAGFADLPVDLEDDAQAVERHLSGVGAGVAKHEEGGRSIVGNDVGQAELERFVAAIDDLQGDAHSPDRGESLGSTDRPVQVFGQNEADLRFDSRMDQAVQGEDAAAVESHAIRQISCR